jgi:hypothetical protein
LQTPGNEEKYNVAHNTGWHPRQSDTELFLFRPQHSTPKTHVAAPTMLCDGKLLALLNVCHLRMQVTSNAADGPFQLFNVHSALCFLFSAATILVKSMLFCLQALFH